MSSKDDKKESLDQLSQQNKASIISQLVDIGAEHNQEEHKKFRTFVEELCCFRLENASEATTLRRTSIDAFSNRRYVALSYTWDPSNDESHENKRFYIQDQHTPSSFTPSLVRDCVFDRALHYMQHKDVDLLWIDRHSICQDACPGGPDGAPCSPSHAVCAQKRGALQAMDLVYQLSKHPVALLGRPIKDAPELRLLHRVLSGDLVDGQEGRSGPSPRLSRGAASIPDARAALSLLHEITRDDWWTRAWTFQENYRGGVWMHLLIRHPPSLEDLKLQLNAENARFGAEKGGGVLGSVPRELCVKSVTFSEQATLLCQALRGVAVHPTADQTRQIADVERAAGRYQLLVPKSSSMTPRVLADVESRKLSQPWDRLAIVANCCRYPVRLNTEALSQRNHSISLSLLAMCLLNGEILDDDGDDDDVASVGGLTASGFLERLMFKKFQAPENEHRRLTFTKGCRLNDVKLTAGGIVARGHLWKLGPIVRTRSFSQTLPFVKRPYGLIEREDRRRLQQLVFHLEGTPHYGFAERLDGYLESDGSRVSRAGGQPQSFAEAHLLTMAKELAAAIRAGRNLRLGRIWGREPPPSGYSAIFIMPDGSQNCGAQGNPRAQPSHVFTSMWPGDDDSSDTIAHDTDCYASLGVDIKEPQAEDGAPQLRIRSWLFGMCFFKRCPRVPVVLPWPKALQENAKKYEGSFATREG
ncbi:hypothetical protein RB601_008572 [Gaeumannomyces tritici]